MYAELWISRPHVDTRFCEPRLHDAPDFALLLNRIARSGNHQWFQADILHPALLVGISPNRDTYHIHPLHDLAFAVQFHLNAHLENWRRANKKPDPPIEPGDGLHGLLGDDFEVGRSGQLDTESVLSSSSVPQILCPPWMVLFGILYESGRDGHLTIVAHIPYAPVGQNLLELDHESTHYVSCVVDRISLPGIMDDPDIHPSPASTSESPYLANFRAAMCLLTLKRHALFMADAWEKTIWPDPITIQIDSIEDGHIGPLRDVSELSGQYGLALSWKSGEGSEGDDSESSGEKGDPQSFLYEALRSEVMESTWKVISWLRGSEEGAREEVEKHVDVVWKTLQDRERGS